MHFSELTDDHTMISGQLYGDVMKLMTTVMPVVIRVLGPKLTEFGFTADQPGVMVRPCAAGTLTGVENHSRADPFPHQHTPDAAPQQFNMAMNPHNGVPEIAAGKS